MQQWNKPLLKNHKITPPSPELPSPLSTSDEVKNRLKTTECIKIIDDHPDNKDPPLIKTRSYKFLLTDNQQQNKGKGKDFIKISTDKRFFILLSHWSSLQDVNQIAQVPHYDGRIGNRVKITDCRATVITIKVRPIMSTVSIRREGRLKRWKSGYLPQRIDNAFAE